MRLSDQIRDELRRAELSGYRISQLTRVPQSSLSRFRAGKAGLTLEHLDRISEVLGLSVAKSMPRVSER